MKFQDEKWEIGKGNVVVTNHPEAVKFLYEHYAKLLINQKSFSDPFAAKNTIEYYGGVPICESVRSDRDLRLIKNAPVMLELLKEIYENNLLNIPKAKFYIGYIEKLIEEIEGDGEVK